MSHRGNRSEHYPRIRIRAESGHPLVIKAYLRAVGSTALGLYADEEGYWQGLDDAFTSGHAGLSFDCDTGLTEVKKELRQLCFHYPGMDIPDFNWLSLHLGTRIRGVSWLNFLGQPVLGEVGGATGLRARLHYPRTTVQALSEDRAVISMGPWPEAGDIQKGEALPAYQEVARVLEPWLLHEEHSPGSAFTPEDLLRWERRFLD